MWHPTQNPTITIIIMNNRYEFTPAGELVRWTPAIVADADRVLNSYARTRPSIADNNLLPGYRVQVSASGAWTVGNKVDRCIINTHFAPVVDENGDSWLAPTYSATATSIETSCEVQMSSISSVDMWFFVRPSYCYLVWHDRVGNKLHIPPFNNIYNDGKVCMGREFSLDATVGAARCWERSWQWFNTTNSNTDLSSGASPLRFHPETKQLRSYTDNRSQTEELLRRCSTVSNAVFEGFFPTQEVTI